MFPVCLILFLPFPVFFGLNINITDVLYVSVLLASTSMHHLPGPKEDRSGHWVPGAELEMVMSQGRGLWKCRRAISPRRYCCQRLTPASSVN